MNAQLFMPIILDTFPFPLEARSVMVIYRDEAFCHSSNWQNWLALYILEIDIGSKS